VHASFSCQELPACRGSAQDWGQGGKGVASAWRSERVDGDVGLECFSAPGRSGISSSGAGICQGRIIVGGRAVRAERPPLTYPVPSAERALISAGQALPSLDDHINTMGPRCLA